MGALPFMIPGRPFGIPEAASDSDSARACFLGSLFTGFLGFGGWGWGLNWLAHGLFLNSLFFGHFGFHGGGGFGPGFGGRVAWAHDAGHRLGVPYSSRAVASRFNGRFEGGRFEGGRFNNSAFNSE